MRTVKPRLDWIRGAAALGGALLALAAAGCASPEPSQPPPPAPRRAAAGEAGVQDRQRVIIGQTLLYPLHHLRAEEVADTLAPILQARYGPNARIVPHLATNSLFIYLPSRREMEESRR